LIKSIYIYFLDSIKGTFSATCEVGAP